MGTNSALRKIVQASGVEDIEGIEVPVQGVEESGERGEDDEEDRETGHTVFGLVGDTKEKEILKERV
jgi:hypothetical protein